jgi:hypothetical protein
MLFTSILIHAKFIIISTSMKNGIRMRLIPKKIVTLKYWSIHAVVVTVQTLLFQQGKLPSNRELQVVSNKVADIQIL